MSQLISDLRAGGGLITSVEGGNNITVNTVGGVATVNVSGTTNHAVQIGNALGALTSLPLGDAGQVLTSNGPGLDPSFQTFIAGLSTLEGDLGGPVGPDGSGNLQVIAGNATNNAGSSVLILGDPGTNTLRLDVTDVNQNVMIGGLTGNLAISGTSNTALGFNAATAITSGASNTVVGRAAFANNTTGIRNTAIGALSMVFNSVSSSCVAVGADSLFESSGDNNVALGDSAFGSGGSGPGSFNIGVGFRSGINCNTATENSNVYLNSFGVAAESNTLRVGNASGVGNQELSRSFIHGIFGVTPPGTLNTVIIDNNGQLGSTLAPSFVAYGQVYNQGAQTIPNGANVTFDSNGPLLNMTHVASSDTITVNDTGLFMIQWTLQTDEFVTSVSLNVNGVSVPSISYVCNPSTESEYNGEGIVLLNSGDLVTLTVFSGASTDLLVLAGFTNASITLEKLNISTGTADSAALFNTDSGVATVAAGAINIVGGTGITTSGAGNTVTINGGGITQINGDTGSATGSPITFTGLSTAGSTVAFNASGSSVTFRVSENPGGNLYMGEDAGQGSTNAITGATQNVALGFQAARNVSGQGNVLLGFLAGGNILAGGSNNVGIGNSSLGGASNASLNVGIGTNTLFSCTGTQNTALGFQALRDGTAVNNNVAIGFNAGVNYTGSESNNILIGANLLGTAAENNTIHLGTTQTRNFQAGIAGVVPPGTLNMVTIDTGTGQLGSQAIPGGGSGITSVLTAFATPQFSLVGTTSTLSFNLSNLALGSSMPALTSGASNTGFGQSVFAAVTSGNSNASFGTLSSFSISTALANSAFGSTALQNLTTGRGNSVFGFSSGSAYTGNETGNILINNPGVAGESNTLRIGTSAAVPEQITRAFIHGIFGATVGVSGIPVVVDNANQLGTVVSSARFKYDIKDLPSTDVLKLRPVSFKYKKTNEDAIGLIAEEVEKVMPSLVAYDESNEAIAVKYNDLPVLLLAEIQKLQMRVKQLEEKLACH